MGVSEMAQLGECGWTSVEDFSISAGTACGIFFRFDRLIHPTPIVEAFSTAEDGTVDAGEGELGMTSRLRPKGPFKFCL